MTRTPPKDLAASVRQRLLNKARESGRPFNEILQYYGMERFLYRLSKSHHVGNFTLKGALMFRVWEGPVSRPTMDIDLLGHLGNRVETVVAISKDVCLQDVEPDGLVFDSSSVEAERIIENAFYEGIRVRLRGTLGTAVVVIQIDIAFGDVIIPSVVSADFPTILDLPHPSLQAYSRESAVAEKFEVMVKLGVLNSRLKDFFDIWLLSTQFDFDGEILATAIKETFTKRGTEIPAQPVALLKDFTGDPTKQSQWRGFIRRNLLENVPENLGDVVDSICIFLGPVAEVVSLGQMFHGYWRCPGPWTAT